MKYLLVAIVILFSYQLGWDSAYFTVGTECKKLGGFYVGKTTFNCSINKNEK